MDAEAEGCDRVAVEARDFQVEDGDGRDGAGVDMGNQGRAREARDPFAGSKIRKSFPGLAVERPDGMVGRAHEGRGRALEGDRGQAMSDGPEASGDMDVGATRPRNRLRPRLTRCRQTCQKCRYRKSVFVPSSIIHTRRLRSLLSPRRTRSSSHNRPRDRSTSRIAILSPWMHPAS